MFFDKSKALLTFLRKFGCRSIVVCNSNVFSFRFVDYLLFSLYQASRKPEKPKTEAQQIQSEVERLCRKCECCTQFQYTKVAENKYRVS